MHVREVTRTPLPTYVVLSGQFLEKKRVNCKSHSIPFPGRTPVAFWRSTFVEDGLDGFATKDFLQSSGDEVVFYLCVRRGHVAMVEVWVRVQAAIFTESRTEDLT